MNQTDVNYERALVAHALGITPKGVDRGHRPSQPADAHDVRLYKLAMRVVKEAKIVLLLPRWLRASGRTPDVIGAVARALSVPRKLVKYNSLATEMSQDAWLARWSSIRYHAKRR